MDETRDAAKDGGDPAGEDLRPPLDFGSLVFPFYSQALLKLGLIELPGHETEGADLPFAQRLIDLLDLLKDKTQGRLKPEEANLLESCLLQLKTHYMQKADILKL